MDSQKVLDTPPLQRWLPQIDDLVWLRTPRKDSKVSTFRVRVMAADADNDTVTVEIFPEFELLTPFTHTTKISDIAPLD